MKTIISCKKFVDYPIRDNVDLEITLNLEEVDPFNLYENPYSKHLFIEKYESYYKGKLQQVYFSNEELYNCICESLRHKDIEEVMQNIGGTF